MEKNPRDPDIAGAVKEADVSTRRNEFAEIAWKLAKAGYSIATTATFKDITANPKKAALIVSKVDTFIVCSITSRRPVRKAERPAVRATILLLAKIHFDADTFRFETRSGTFAEFLRRLGAVERPSEPA